MTMLRSYPDYKPSGIEWLDNIPGHWEVRRLRDCVLDSIAGIWGDDPEPQNIEDHVWCIRVADFNMESLRISDIKKTMRAVPSSAKVSRLLRKGDILLEKSGGGENQPVGRAVMFDRDDMAVTSNFVTRLRPRPATVHSKFLLAVMDSLQAARITQLSIKQTTGIQNLDERHYLSNLIPLPPLDEQRAIADFLDAMDERITRFIAARRRMIALLEEQKQAIINKGVTRGLDPDVPMKPSGIDWLGDIPAHWEIKRLKGLASVQTGLTLGKFYGDQLLQERPYIRVANVQAGYLKLDSVTTVQVPKSEIDRTTLRVGDVLMTEGGDIDKLGRGTVWSGEIPDCLHQNHVFAVRPDFRRLSPRYLVQLLASQIGRTYFELTAKKTTNLAATNSTTLREFAIPLPSLSEQEALISSIMQDSEKVDAVKDRNQQEIDLIQEYRTRLVSDVVTGKLDVRGVDLPRLEGDLPNMIDSPEDIEELAMARFENN